MIQFKTIFQPAAIGETGGVLIAIDSETGARTSMAIDMFLPFFKWRYRRACAKLAKRLQDRIINSVAAKYDLDPANLKYTDGAETGVGVEFWVMEEESERLFYVCDDQSDLTIAEQTEGNDL